MDISGLTAKTVEPPAASRAARAPSPGPRAGSGAATSVAPATSTVMSGSNERALAAIDHLIARTSENVRTGSRIRVDETTDRFVFQIVNANNEVIRQIPPEDVLEALARFREITGLIFDQQV